MTLLAEVALQTDTVAFYFNMHVQVTLDYMYVIVFIGYMFIQALDAVINLNTDTFLFVPNNKNVKCHTLLFLCNCKIGFLLYRKLENYKMSLFVVFV